ncbi:hypothetical protein FE257_012940 [Aspergillus nanangensis]|uniref:DNA (cytosine-5-)-methyltransferase n=1 Tax=Aspergillus nanangensis TaxID=2582783 RepID=A0AAD4GRI7_ASPNN|nr:hypothetical protein FE257_012940 [Aspergillus nanangensis]
MSMSTTLDPDISDHQPPGSTGDSRDDGEEFDFSSPKSITRQLNISKSYVSTLSVQDAFQHLYQNWRDAIIATFNLTHPFEPQFEQTSDFIRIVMPMPNKTPPQYMGYIQFAKKTGHVTLVNACSTLQPKHLQLGSTSKRHDPRLAGRHGEGLKIAVLVLMREGHQVRIEASRHKWRFGFKSPPITQFTCTMNPSKKPINTDAESHAAMSKFKNRIATDVAIFISPGAGIKPSDFMEWLQVTLDILNPRDTIKTTGGDLFLDESFSNKIYLKGLLLPQSPSASKNLIYGYNFYSGALNRDRTRMTDRKEESRMITQIWEEAIALDEQILLPKFVDMLRQSPPPWDARKNEFYYLNTQESDVGIINQSLGKQPAALPPVLWSILRKAKMIRTPQEERTEQFKGAPECVVSNATFPQNVQRLIKASLELDTATKDIPVTFVHCNKTNTGVFFNPVSGVLTVDKKWLDYTAIHTEYPCRLSRVNQGCPEFYCSHIVGRLYEHSLEDIFRPPTNPELNKWREFMCSAVHEKLEEMPRRITVEQLPSESTRPKLKVSWEHGFSDELLPQLGNHIQYEVVLNKSRCTSATKRLLRVQDSSTRCDCNRAIVPLTSSQNSVVFDVDCVESQELKGSYFPTVARNEDKVFYGATPKPLAIDSALLQQKPPSTANKANADKEGPRGGRITDHGLQTTADFQNVQINCEDYKFWENWNAEVFPKIFCNLNPGDAYDNERRGRPVATFFSSRLGKRLEKNGSFKVEMTGLNTPEHLYHRILFIHGIYPPINSEEGDEGAVLASQYSFLHDSRIFSAKENSENCPSPHEKELYLHFNDFDSMGQKHDASEIPIQKIIAIETVNRLHLTRNIPSGESIPGKSTEDDLFCRFAVRCDGSKDSACLVPIASHLPLDCPDHWPSPNFNTKFNPIVLDMSPCVLGLALGFRHFGHDANASLASHAESVITQSNDNATSLHHNNFDVIMSSTPSQSHSTLHDVPSSIPNIGILSIPDKEIAQRKVQMTEEMKVFEYIGEILSAKPKLDFLVFTLPPWVFHEDAYGKLLSGMYALLEGRYCLHFKKLHLSSHGVPRDETMVVLLASSVYSSIPWAKFFGEELETSAMNKIIDLDFHNSGAGSDHAICKHPVSGMRVLNHHTGVPLENQQPLALGSSITMGEIHRTAHPKRNDRLTVREIARIQGFDDNFVFSGSLNKQYKDVTQAVPVPIVRKMADVVRSMIHEFKGVEHLTTSSTGLMTATLKDTRYI